MEFRMKYSDIEFNFKHMYLDRTNSGHVKSDCEFKKTHFTYQMFIVLMFYVFLLHQFVN